MLAIVAWVTAAAAAWFLHPAVLPLAKQYINANTVALVAAIGGIFIVTLIIVSIITVKVSDLILDRASARSTGPSASCSEPPAAS